MSDMLQHALGWASREFPVFPCKPIDKRPLTRNGFKDASTDPNLISDWWARYPDAMIGVPTGQVSGVFAIDPDVPKKPGDPDGLEAWSGLIAEHGGIPDTHAHHTPSGGRHVLFRWDGSRPVTNRDCGLPEGVNVRGEGGYIIVPPSRRQDGKEYRLVDPVQAFRFADAPDWLHERLRSGRTSFQPRTFGGAQRKTANIERTANAGERILTEELEILTTTRHHRNDQLNRSAFKLGMVSAAGVLDADVAQDLLMGAATANGYIAKDGPAAAQATIASGFRSGFEKLRDVLSEDAVALHFRARFEHRFCYCHDMGSWFVWVDVFWKRDDTGLALYEARNLTRELAQEEDAETQVKSLKTSFVGGVERFARSDPAFAVTAQHWDQDPFLLGTPDGTIDLRAGELRPADPKDGITKLAAVGPADEADCPRWLQFLHEATAGDQELIRFLQQWCGYSLTGNTDEHALVFVYGPGGNGKSVFLNVLTGILKDYAATAAMDTFTVSNGDKHPTDLAMLRGARLVTASETEEGRAWAEARIKQMTGGDPISARYMRQDFFTYLPQFKLTIVGNHKPRLQNVDDAVRRRFNMVPFTRKPAAPDKHLEEKLRAEWPGILRWMVDGCLDWQTHGLVRAVSVTEATDTYFSDQDLLAQFLDEKCDCDPGNESKFESSATLFEGWRAYARDAGEPAGSQRTFNDQLRARGFGDPKQIRALGTKGFRGIRLRTPHSRLRESDA